MVFVQCCGIGSRAAGSTGGAAAGSEGPSFSLAELVTRWWVEHVLVNEFVDFLPYEVHSFRLDEHVGVVQVSNDELLTGRVEDSVCS
jgi:hypothetical protein